MAATDFDRRRCHGTVRKVRRGTRFFRIDAKRVGNMEMFPRRFGGLTKRVGNRFSSMAVGKTLKQQRNVSVAEDAALGVMRAADYLQETLAGICEHHGITSYQYGML